MGEHFEQRKLTPLTEIGEFGLIDHLTKNIVLVNPETRYGVGDDAAVLQYGEKLMLVSTDILTEGIHFDLTYFPLQHLGYKAIAVNLSDIYAMNGTPKQVTVSLAVSSKFSLEAIEKIYSGIHRACANFNVDIIGGDTASSNAGLFLSVTVLGSADPEDVVYRHGANEKDLICVTGDLGAAFMGLLLLEREKTVFKADPNMQPDFAGKDFLLEKQLKPEPRKDIIDLFREKKIKPTAMIDISDGLASEVFHLGKRSGLGATIYEEKLPIFQTTFDTAREFSIDPTTAALNGGEDYELLFTITQHDYEKIKTFSDISIIGHMVEASYGFQLISKNGVQTPLKAQGWDAFNTIK
ncbi:MAG: thiamine-phosphate kinase [Bacteroidales bacterium]|nr:thiamine-phosphate kinase [Bacteroidales bacterium]